MFGLSFRVEDQNVVKHKGLHKQFQGRVCLECEENIQIYKETSAKVENTTVHSSSHHPEMLCQLRVQ